MEKNLSVIMNQMAGVFLQYGYEGATLSRISKATGLGRASLYHHFSGGKERMAEAVLSHLFEDFRAIVLSPLQSEKDPIERLRAMSESLVQFYNHGQLNCILAVFSLGDGQTLFKKPVQEAMDTWLELLSGVLKEAGLPTALAQQRAEDAVIQIQGALVLARVLNRAEAFERLLKNLPTQLLLDDTDHLSR